MDTMPHIRLRPTATLLLVGIALGAPTPGRGAPPSTTCSFTTLPAIAFGDYDPTVATDADTSSTFQFDCSNASVRADVYLSAGTGSVASREMDQAGSRLLYNLYLDAPGGTIWGDGSPPYSFLTGAQRRTSYPVYGRLFAGQWVSAGSYLDTITITLLF